MRFELTADEWSAHLDAAEISDIDWNDLEEVQLLCSLLLFFTPCRWMRAVEAAKLSDSIWDSK